MTIDPAAQAFTAQGIAVAGIAVTFQRRSGATPRTRLWSADVVAIVRMDQPDGLEPARDGIGSREPGSLSQDDRKVVVMAGDLRDGRFPLPVRKGDNVLIKDTGEKFKVTRVDPYVRALAGAIEITVTGVS